jgi:hypothetical protein
LQFGRQETPGCRKTLNPTPPSFHISATQTKSKNQKPNQQNLLIIHSHSTETGFQTKTKTKSEKTSSYFTTLHQYNLNSQPKPNKNSNRIKTSSSFSTLHQYKPNSKPKPNQTFLRITHCPSTKPNFKPKTVTKSNLLLITQFPPTQTKFENASARSESSGTWMLVVAMALNPNP